jgi:catechol-2,3-dioxygenase
MSVTKVRIVVQAGDVVRSAVFYEALLGVPPAHRHAALAVFDLESPSLLLTVEERPRVRGSPRRADFALIVAEPQHVGDAAIRLRRASIRLRIQDHGIEALDPDGNTWRVRFAPSTRVPAVVSS